MQEDKRAAAAVLRRRKSSLSSTRIMRSANAVAVLRMLYTEGTCSRTRLTELTGMSPATITRIIAELKERGLVVETGLEDSSGGRRPISLTLNSGRIFIIGLRILSDRVEIAVSDLRGALIAQRHFLPPSREPEQVFAKIASVLSAMLSELEVATEYVLGVGVAITGIVDAASGRLVLSDMLGWSGVEIGRRLEAYLGLPVVVENDANAATLAEYWLGAAKGAASVLYLKTDQGVGTGLVFQGHLLPGARGMVGEIGHVPVIADGRPCRCLQRGCLHTYLYMPEVLQRYKELTGTEAPDARALFARAGNGDTAAALLVQEAGTALCTAVALAAGLLDLEMAIIGGAWGRQEAHLLGGVEAFCRASLSRSGMSREFRVIGSSLGDGADLLGAICLVINRWFTPPIQTMQGLLLGAATQNR